MNNDSVESTSGVYTLSIAADLSGIPVHSIRQYIDKGLLIPFTKETSRHLFSKVDIMWLKFIQKLINEKGLNIAGIRTMLSLIPCWTIRSCSVQDRDRCKAYHSDFSPCWDASEKGNACKNLNCKECDVYRVVENYPDLKSFLKNTNSFKI